MSIFVRVNQMTKGFIWHNSFQFVSLFSDSYLTPLTVPTSIISNIVNHLSTLFVKRCSRENSMYQFFICEIYTHIQPQKIGFVLLPCGMSYERLKKVRPMRSFPVWMSTGILFIYWFIVCHHSLFRSLNILLSPS